MPRVQYALLWATHHLIKRFTPAPELEIWIDFEANETSGSLYNPVL